jgi:hypothetical protein
MERKAPIECGIVKAYDGRRTGAERAELMQAASMVDNAEMAVADKPVEEQTQREHGRYSVLAASMLARSVPWIQPSIAGLNRGRK